MKTLQILNEKLYIYNKYLLFIAAITFQNSVSQIISVIMTWHTSKVVSIDNKLNNITVQYGVT